MGNTSGALLSSYTYLGVPCCCTVVQGVCLSFQRWPRFWQISHHLSFSRGNTKFMMCFIYGHNVVHSLVRTYLFIISRLLHVHDMLTLLTRVLQVSVHSYWLTDVKLVKHLTSFSLHQVSRYRVWFILITTYTTWTPLLRKLDIKITY